MRAIGIDLGTTNSVVAIAGRELPRVLPNREGQSLTPSVVSLVKRRGAEAGEIVVGRQAVSNAQREPESTIFSIKRLMGRDYGDSRVAEVRERYGLQLASPPAADVDDQGVKVLIGGKEHTPVEVSAMILKQLKADAELALGEPVTHAVITVPAYFEERQRRATRDAGALAGLDVLEIIDEPTAAALAFGMGKQDQKHRVLVYDLGGGTFDISLIQMTKNNYSVLEIQGDNWLGGDDFDHAIINRMTEWTKNELGFDPATHPSFMTRAKTDAQAAKMALGTAQRAQILNTLYNVKDRGTLDIDMEITREQFEADIAEKLGRTIELVQIALRNQSLSADDITAVLLVGGSTAIPMVHRLLAQQFGEGKLKRDINPMECVALGAAIRADRFELKQQGVSPQKQDDWGSIQHVTPMHLGIAAVKDGDPDYFVPIIEKGTPYPLDSPRSRSFKPSEAKQKRIRVPVYEGLSQKASLNEQQGVIEVPLPEALDASQSIDIAFDYDRNRVLTVKVKIAGSDKVYSETLKPGPRTQRPDNKGPKPPQSDWRDDLSGAIRVGKTFVQGYSLYMTKEDSDEILDAINQAEKALTSGDEKAGSRARLLVENKVMSSGLASMMYVADRVLQRAPARHATVLAQAIAALRQDFARGPGPQTDALVQNVRLIIAEILNKPVPQPGQGGTSFNNLLQT